MNQEIKDKIIELHEKYGDIQIKCKGADSLPLDSMIEFQGNLKKGKKENLIKLITLIFKIGFKAPFFIWEHEGDRLIIDGHRRIEGLCLIREAGIAIPELFPVDYIYAETIQEAKESVLAISSQYGEYEEDILSDWLNSIDKEIAETLRLVDSEIKINTPTLLDFDDINQSAEQDVEVFTCPKCGFSWQK